MEHMFKSRLKIILVQPEILPDTRNLSDASAQVLVSIRFVQGDFIGSWLLIKP